MIHRYISELIKGSIEAITQDPVLLDDLFAGNYELVTSEADAIKAYFAREGLNVVTGYPRNTTEFPAVCIILGEESQDEEVIGDTGGFIDDEDDENLGKEIYTSFWNHSYRLLIITEHPDVTSYYYEIVKYILAYGQKSLEKDGCLNFHMSGNDLAPDPRYLPDHLFARQLTFRCEREFQLIIRDSDLRYGGLRVSGIHVDKGGSKNDVGSVNTGVKPYTE
jgi:hypothetical protein